MVHTSDDGPRPGGPTSSTMCSRHAIRVGLPGAWALKHTIGSYLQMILKYLWQLVLALDYKVVEGGLL